MRKLRHQHNQAQWGVLFVLVTFAASSAERLSLSSFVTWHTHEHAAHSSHHHETDHEAAQQIIAHHTHKHQHTAPTFRGVGLNPSASDCLMSSAASARLNVAPTASPLLYLTLSDTLAISPAGMEFFLITKPPPVLSYLLLALLPPRAPPIFV